MTGIEAPHGEIGPVRLARWKALLIAGGAIIATTFPLSSVAASAAGGAVIDIRVTDVTGAPLAGVDVLTTVLWTSRADFRRFGRPRGQLLRTDAQGEIAIGLRLDRQQSASVKRNGQWANIAVVGFDERGQPASFATTSRYLGTKPEKRAQAATMAHSEIVRLVQSPPTAPGTQVGDAAALTSSVANCPYYYWDADSYWNRYAQVGELHADSDVLNARFTYGQTADTTFDIVERAGTGDWTVSGGVHIENTRSETVYAETAGQSNYHWALRTQFRFVNMKLFKDCIGGPYRVWTGSQQAYALEWTGNGMTLSNTLTQPPRKDAYSARYGAHSGFTRMSGTLVKWSAAVTLWGASVAAQSGASQFVKLEYSFGGKPTHYMYGDSGLPSQSKRVFQDTP